MSEHRIQMGQEIILQSDREWRESQIGCNSNKTFARGVKGLFVPSRLKNLFSVLVFLLSRFLSIGGRNNISWFFSSKDLQSIKLVVASYSCWWILGHFHRKGTFNQFSDINPCKPLSLLPPLPSLYRLISHESFSPSLLLLSCESHSYPSLTSFEKARDCLLLFRKILLLGRRRKRKGKNMVPNDRILLSIVTLGWRLLESFFFYLFFGLLIDGCGCFKNKERRRGEKQERRKERDDGKYRTK